MRKMHLGAMFLAVLAITGVTQATMMNGSVPLVPFGTSGNANSGTQFTWLFLMPDTGAGDFASYPAAQTISSVGTMSLNNLSAWTFSKPDFGTWTTTSGTYERPYSGYLHVTLTGTFAPGTSFVGKTASPGIMNISFNQSGSSISSNMTMAVTPEPATVGLLLMGGALVVRKHRRSRV